MCGIAGYSINPEASPFTPDLSKIKDVLHHRGPDGHGTFVDAEQGVGLAHVRLSIIDLNESGAQPMHSMDGQHALSYNGEIYNFAELRSELHMKEHTFNGTSDTEVLLQLLQTKGTEILPRLNGMFAFAHFDARTGELTIVRDAYGIKPLYYCELPNAVMFASEIRGLQSMGLKTLAPRPETLGRYLSFLWNPGSDTPASNVHTLQPGEAMVLKAGSVVKRWTWFIAPILSPQIATTSSDQLIEQTTEELRKAVHRQMVADVPVGAFLSGGLDSSAVVALAKEKSPSITCYTIEAAGGSEEGTADDLPYARCVAKHLNVPLEVVHVNPNEMAHDLERMVLQLEEPLADLACLNVFYISRLAREQGVKVLLSGTGGDDLFTGYRRHRAIAIDQKLQHVPAFIRRGLAKFGTRLDRSRSSTRRIVKFLDGFDTSGSERLINYFLWTGRDDLIALFSPKLRDEIVKSDLLGGMKDYLSQVEPETDPINAMLALEQRFFLAEHNLLYTDKMSMAASIEVRVPFLDLDLADFASTLPTKIKQRGKEGKWVLKKAMEPFLPRDVIYRPKTGFGVPLRRWLQGGLNEMMHDLLSPANISHRGIFDADAVQTLILQEATGKRNASYTILSLMCIEIWCQAYIDNPSPSLNLLADGKFHHSHI